MEIILKLLMVYAVCWLVHFIGNWFDFDYPVKLEAKAKKTAKEKYGIDYKCKGEKKAVEFLNKD